MRKLAILAALSSGLLAGSTSAREQLSPASQSLKIHIEAAGTERKNGTLLIAVTITQQAVVYENGQPFTHRYIGYFQDHELVEADICVAPARQPEECFLLSSLLEPPASKRQEAAKAVKANFLEIYAHEVKPNVETWLLKDLPRQPQEAHDFPLARA